MRFILYFSSLLLLLNSCQSDKRQLKVTLYPYIPTGNNQDNYNTLKQRLESEFEKQNPNIDLKLTLDLKADPYDLADWDKAKDKMKLLSQEGSDVVEIDTLYIKQLTKANLIHEVKIDKSLYFEAATDSVTVDGKTFGTPSWMCGLYLFSTSKKVSEAKSIKEVIETNKKEFPNNPEILGKFNGTYTLALHYLDSLVDSNPQINHSEFLSKPAKISVLEDLNLLFSSCIDSKDRSYECGKETYSKNKKIGDAFFNKEAKTFVGYGELLHSLKSAKKAGHLDNKIHFTSLPSGSGSKPVSLTDALVINKSKCKKQCYEDALTFSKYYSSAKTLGWITLNQDNLGHPPRYLTPSIISFYNEQHDDAYKTFHQVSKNSIAAPNGELAANRGRIKKQIMDYLTKRNKAYSIYHKEFQKPKSKANDKDKG